MYYAMISQIDFYVGRMVEELKRRDLYNDTLIVYTSDHGEYLGFHHMITKGNRMYDPIVRVPFVMKPPSWANRSPLRNNDSLFSLIDLFPTIVDVAGIECPDQLPGFSVFNHQAGRDAVFAEVYEGKEYMIRTREHKLLVHRDPAQSLLFDMAHDPLEMENKFNDTRFETIRMDLSDRLIRWSLFDAVPHPYINDDAPVVSVPKQSGGYDAAGMRRWFEEQINECLGGTGNEIT